MHKHNQVFLCHILSLFLKLTLSLWKLGIRHEQEETGHGSFSSKLVASFCRFCLIHSHETSLVLTCVALQSGQPRMPVRNHGNMEGGLIRPTKIGCVHMHCTHTHTHAAPRLPFSLWLSLSHGLSKRTHTHTHTHTIHFQRELIHNMAWQRKFSADSFMEWESSPSLLPWCHFLSNRSLVSGQWILACWLRSLMQPTLLISCPVKINEMLSVSGAHLSRKGSMDLDSSVWPKESGDLFCNSPYSDSVLTNSIKFTLFHQSNPLSINAAIHWDSYLSAPGRCQLEPTRLSYNMESGRKVQCVTHSLNWINCFAVWCQLPEPAFLCCNASTMRHFQKD